jgi:cell filamentation protein
MNNDSNYDYYYEDKENIYILSDGLLKNKLGVTDQKKLIVAETYYTTQRIGELKKNPISIDSSLTLLDIHRHIFQDIYEWAGKLRMVGIRKSGTTFSPI